MSSRRAIPALFALLLVAPPALSEPRQTGWVEDLHIEPEGETETAFLYELRGTDVAALDQAADLLTLRFGAGITSAVEVGPTLIARQRGPEPLRLHEVGVDVRGRVLGEPDAPNLLVFGRYLNDLSEEHDHVASTGLAGRWDVSRLFVSASLLGTGALGDDRDDAVEAWVGAAVGYAFFPERQLSAGIETFAVVPLAGERISDPTFGMSAESTSFYYGPTLSSHLGPLWSTLSAATGYPLSEPASHLLLRWMVGIGH